MLAKKVIKFPEPTEALTDFLNQQSKTQKYSVYFSNRVRKTENPHISGASTSPVFKFFLN